jgi:hypothetical protein
VTVLNIVLKICVSGLRTKNAGDCPDRVATVERLEPQPTERTEKLVFAARLYKFNDAQTQQHEKHCGQ